MRALIVLSLLLLAAGCGGGGGAPGPGPDPDPDPDPVADARTKEILEDCLPDVLTEAGDLSRLLDAIFKGNGSAQGAELPADGAGGFLVEGPPDFEFTRIAWEHDPGGIGEIAGNGEFEFGDGMGGQVAVFTEGQVDQLRSGGIDALGALLLTLADGTVVRARYNGVGLETALLNVEITFTSGQPAGTTGQLELQSPMCAASLTLTDVPFAGLLPALPTGTFGVVLNAGADTVSGTIVTDGTSTASASVSRDGGPVTNWSIDLTTGVATQL